MRTVLMLLAFCLYLASASVLRTRRDAAKPDPAPAPTPVDKPGPKTPLKTKAHKAKKAKKGRKAGKKGRKGKHLKNMNARKMKELRENGLPLPREMPIPDCEGARMACESLCGEDAIVQCNVAVPVDSNCKCRSFLI